MPATIQIIGTKKCKNTRKADRFFRERGLRPHLVDLNERLLPIGELQNICRNLEAEDLLDKESKAYQKAGLAYMLFDPIEEAVKNPTVLKTPIVRRGRVLHLLREHGAMIRKNATIETIGSDSVSYTYKDEVISVPCKQVIIAIGAEPDSALEQQLTTSGAQVHRIGDCRDKSFIDGAILDARKLAEQFH